MSKFKVEEESTKSKKLEETSAKIRDAASALGNTGQCRSNCHERNHTVRSHLPNWQNVSQCFSVQS